MAILSKINITGYLEGLLSGSRAINPAQISNALSVAQDVHVELANGDNTIPVPSGTSGKTMGVLILTDPTGTTVKTVRTTGMASGIPLRAAGGVHLHVFPDPPPTSIIINSNAAEPGKITELLFF